MTIPIRCVDRELHWASFARRHTQRRTRWWSTLRAFEDIPARRGQHPRRRKYAITNISSSLRLVVVHWWTSWLHFLFLTARYGEWHPCIRGILILNTAKFYSEAILSRRGPLAKVWLAAHMERKLSKTQTLQTDIEQAAGVYLFSCVRSSFSPSARCDYGTRG